MNHETYHKRLKAKMDTYVHSVYALTKSFPSEERYGATSQLRRSSLSVILNYIEGYARAKDKVHRNFLEISYGSLQESKYLLGFCCDEKYISKKDYDFILSSAEEIGAMLYGTLREL